MRSNSAKKIKNNLSMNKPQTLKLVNIYNYFEFQFTTFRIHLNYLKNCYQTMY